MSELDVDIRAVSSASYGGRVAASDTNQASTDDQSVLINQTDTTQSIQAASASPVAAVTVTSDGSTTLASVQPTFRYDSFRFIYRSDYGRIVLVDQDPETGKPISQVPSQRALQIYAEQERSEGQVAPSTTTGTNVQAGTGGGRRSAGATTTPSMSSGRSSTFINAVVSAALSPSLSSTPSPAFLVPSFSPVNITI